MIILGPVAIAKNNVIGSHNDLPWYLPEDLKHFREITAGKTVLMGRKTYESIVARNGKPLPKRTNIVITSNADYAVAEGVRVYPSISQAIVANPEQDIFLIGGAGIFAEGLNIAEYMYVTHVHQEYPGDIYFPEVNWNEWEKTKEDVYEAYTFAEYKRNIK